MGRKKAMFNSNNKLGQMRTALLRVILQRVMVIPCRRFGTRSRSRLQGSLSTSLWRWKL